MLPAFASSRRLPPGKSEARALAGTRLELCTRWPAGADAARVHRCSKTSTRPFFAPLSRAIPGRVRFHDFCRSMFQRALPWTTRTSRTSGIRGRDGCLIRSIVAFRSRTTAGGTQGQGPRITEPSALPPGIAPARDFAPTPIASDTSCRGHRPSPAWSRRRDERSRQRRAR